MDNGNYEIQGVSTAWWFWFVNIIKFGKAWWKKLLGNLTGILNCLPNCLKERFQNLLCTCHLIVSSVRMLATIPCAGCKVLASCGGELVFLGSWFPSSNYSSPSLPHAGRLGYGTSSPSQCVDGLSSSSEGVVALSLLLEAMQSLKITPSTAQKPWIASALLTCCKPPACNNISEFTVTKTRSHQSNASPRS